MAVRIEQVDRYEEEVLERLMARNLGPSISTMELRRERCEHFEKRAQTIRFAALDGDEVVGLSWGQAKSPSRFVMNVSLVEQEYRGQGIYTSMLDAMLEATTDYDEVDSQHHILNNTIIRIKLGRGFHIIGIDQSILIGPRVLMRYYHNAELLELMRRRTGLDAS